MISSASSNSHSCTVETAIRLIAVSYPLSCASLTMSMRRRNLVDIGRHPDHVQHALIARQNVLVIVGALGIGHHRELEIGVVLADDAPDIFLCHRTSTGHTRSGQKSSWRPCSPIPYSRCLPSTQACIDGLDQSHRQTVVVHQPTVSNGAVQHPDLGTIGQPVPGATLFGFHHVHRLYLLFVCIALRSKSDLQSS